jgi:ARG and Rhodanese-Phosphatase-superfamily-associated Protein domain
MIVRLCFALLSALSVAASAGQAFAFSLGDARITNTLTHGNLSVHLLQGQSGAGPAPLTLHQASGQGLARVHVQGKQIVVSNAATQSVFIQAGTLLTGATQDQVVLQSLIVAPGATNIPLNTFCVESQRSIARPGISATEYVPAQAFAPLPEVARSRLAENGPDSKRESLIRQFGIWLSIDDLRSKLAGTIETHGALDNSLANLVNSPAIERAIRPAVDALAGVDSDASGAVIMIGDRVAGLEAYASPTLFAAQWPRLLRAYAIEALVAPAPAGDALDRAARATAFLAQARQADAIADAWLASDSSDARAVHRAVAGEPRAVTTDPARTQALVSDTLRTIAPGTADHPRILAMLRAVHDQADGSVGAMLHAVRQILIARALPNLNAVKDLIALGQVRPAPASFELAPVLVAVAIGVIGLFARRRALVGKAVQPAAEAPRRAPEANRAAIVQALLRDAVAAAERYARVRNAVMPATSTPPSGSRAKTTPFVSSA